jgi:hypothetical protein
VHRSHPKSAGGLGKKNVSIKNPENLLALLKDIKLESKDIIEPLYTSIPIEY